MTFRIPDTFERKWQEITVINGVLKISYMRDRDDTILEITD